ncbi:FecR family protein [Marinobacterium sp. YM272]|uniref:FecR family protein n=1 Tax=Marinobacterium sp. YM272 TaxID=3421654 RepID=UPI003D7F6EA0
MSVRTSLISTLLTTSLLAALPAGADERAGTFKAINGSVSIDRSGDTLTPVIGDGVMTGDLITTQNASFAAVTLIDGTRLTAGPNSEMVINDFAFDTTTHEGRLNANVKKGSLAVISGKLSKANPDSVRFNTGSMTLGVRGTEFIIEAAGGAGDE